MLGYSLKWVSRITFNNNPCEKYDNVETILLEQESSEIQLTRKKLRVPLFVPKSRIKRYRSNLFKI